jgi:hypothetical protein
MIAIGRRGGSKGVVRAIDWARGGRQSIMLSVQFVCVCGYGSEVHFHSDIIRVRVYVRATSMYCTVSHFVHVLYLLVHVGPETASRDLL